MRNLTTPDQIDFEKGKGMVPAIVQDAQTRKVLMLGYMNAEAVAATLSSGKVTFYSRSKQRLWTKGETSGHFLHLEDILVDCDRDTLLVRATPEGPACHTGDDTCFQEDNTEDGLDFLNHLTAVIRDRKQRSPEGSYVAGLFARGLDKIVQKVGEEAVELIIEAKDDDNDSFRNEAADLLFHYMVLLEAKGHRLEDIVKVLKERH